MRVVVNETEFEADPNNSMIITCTNDLFNGMYIDHDDSYAFIPAAMEGYPELAFTAVFNKIPLLDIQMPDDYEARCRYLEQEPLKWIANTLARLAVKAGEDIRDGTPEV